MTITKEQLSKLPDELVLKAVNACMEYAYVSACCEASVERLIEDLGVEIKEKLNAKKKVDYSVLIKHKIICEHVVGRIFIPSEGDKNLIDLPVIPFQPLTNYWFSALNFEDAEQVVSDLLEAGFCVEETGEYSLELREHTMTAFKINGAAEGYVW